MRFLTDITTNASNLCLLNVKKLYDIRVGQKKMIFIDPGVYELAKSNEYSQIDVLHRLARSKLSENWFVSIDYPCDMLINKIEHNFCMGMNLFSFDRYMQHYKEFIHKSIQNNLKYALNNQYICTIQSEFLNFEDFVKQFQLLRDLVFLSNSNKIIGIGNMCRIKFPNEFTDNVFEYLFEHVSKNRWLHFYGLSLACIKKYIPKMEQKFRISIDSTKWTRAVNNEFKLKNGVCCRKHNRDKYFLRYIEEIKKEGIKICY